MTVSGCDPAFGKLAFLALPGRTWSLQGPILDPRGVPKRVQNRHGEARSAPLAAKVGQKALPKGSQNGVEKLSNRCPKMRAFGIARTFKNAVRYCKIQVLRGSEKYRKIMKSGSQNGSKKHAKWSHWRPKGGQWATLSPTLVDFEGSENRSIFEAPSGRRKVDGCSPLG